MTRVCQAVNRFEIVFEILFIKGGPCLSPLLFVSKIRLGVLGGLPMQVKGPEGNNSEDLDFAELNRRSAKDVICA